MFTGFLYESGNIECIGTFEKFVKFVAFLLTQPQDECYEDADCKVCLTPHTPHLTLHTSHLTPHTSQATIGIDFLSKTMYLEDRTVRLQVRPITTGLEFTFAHNPTSSLAPLSNRPPPAAII